MIRAVVDTNVWVSAFLSPHGPPAKVVEAFVDGNFVAVVPELVLSELRLVLARDRIRRKTGHTDEQAERYAVLIADVADVVSTGGKRFGCRDPKDDALLEAAVVAGAGYVVTRDDDLKRDLDLIRHMRELNVAVVSVSTFLSQLP